MTRQARRQKTKWIKVKKKQGFKWFHGKLWKPFRWVIQGIIIGDDDE